MRHLYGLVGAEVVLVEGLQPASVIVRMRYYVYIQNAISPADSYRASEGAFGAM